MSSSSFAARSRHLVEIQPICDMAALAMPGKVTAHDLALYALDHIIESSALSYEHAVSVSDLRQHLANRILALDPEVPEAAAEATAMKIIARLRNETQNGGGFPFEADVMSDEGEILRYEFNYVSGKSVGAGAETRSVLVPQDAAMRLVLAALDPHEVEAVNLETKAAERAVKAGRLDEATRRATAMRKRMIAQSDKVREVEHRLAVAPDSIGTEDVAALERAIGIVGGWHSLAHHLRHMLRHGIDALLQASPDSRRIMHEARELQSEVERAFTYASDLNALTQRFFRQAGEVASENIFRPDIAEGIDLAGAVLPALLSTRMDLVLDETAGHSAIFAPPEAPLCFDPAVAIPRMIENFNSDLERRIEQVFEDEEDEEAIEDPAARIEEISADGQAWLADILARHGRVTLARLTEIAGPELISPDVLRAAGLHMIFAVGDDDAAKAFRARATFEGRVTTDAFLGDNIKMETIDAE